MKTQLSLIELATEIQRRQVAKQDYVLPTSALTMADDGTLILRGEHSAAPLELPANDTAHDQIAARLAIPSKYYEKMRGFNPALLAKNVNAWLQETDETRMIRTLDGKARAFLSNRYQRIENEEIAELVLPILAEQDGMRIVSAAITPTRMHIKAVFPRIEGEVSKGDFVQAGIAISNSEVGHGAVKIEPLIYRLVCLNGMILPDQKYRARHVGGAMEALDGVYSILSDEALQADDRAKLLKVRDVVRASTDMVRFQHNLDAMRETTTQMLEGDPVQAIKVLGKKVGLLEMEQGGVLRHLIDGGDISRYGVLNAVTRYSQDVESYERATALEAMGGTILQMPQRDWRQIALAA